MLKGKLSKTNFYNWYEADYTGKYNKDQLYKVLLNKTVIGYGFFTELRIRLLHDSTILLNRVVFISNGCIPTGYAPNREDSLIDGYELIPVDFNDLSILQNAVNTIIEELKSYNNGKGTINWDYHLDSINKYMSVINLISISKRVTDIIGTEVCLGQKV